MKLISGSLDRMNFVPEVATRLAVGAVFVQAGWGKFGNMDRLREGFAGMGIPAPDLMAPFVAGVELVAGALLVMGFLTRFAAFPLIIIMAVALMTAHAADYNGIMELFKQKTFLWALLLTWLLVRGGGVFSVDHFFALRRK